ncbi:MAG: alpha/beta hydrolase [Anaerolineales bacterium]|nr:alpha/beta hydrolase [Anaerolineales bacterium]
MFRKYTLVSFVLISLLLASCGPQNLVTATSTVSSAPALTLTSTPNVTPTLPSVTLAGTELRSIQSKNTGRDYDIYILLPADYAQRQGKTYPVLYVLDGQWDFKLYDSIYGGLHYDAFVPDMIIVGITYSGANPDYEGLRAMDFTPVPAGYHPGSGDAPKFLSFIKDELTPLIESNYRVDPSRRILTGSSYAGLFTLYALFSDPSFFSGYISASPAVTYGSFVIRDLEEAYFAQHQDLPVRLFVSVGGIEDLNQPVQDFVQIIQGRNYSDLIMESRVIEGERHAGNKPEAFNRGLRFIFQSK